MLISLSKGKHAIIDDNDGHLSNFRWYCSSWGYAVRHFDKPDGSRGLAYLHHAIIGQDINGLFVDHINGDKLDNRRENLRFVSRRGNAVNSISRRSGRTLSRFPGVTFHHKAKRSGTVYWVARAHINGKKKHLGLFTSEKEAANAYKIAFGY